MNFQFYYGHDEYEQKLVIVQNILQLLLISKHLNIYYFVLDYISSHKKSILLCFAFIISQPNDSIRRILLSQKSNINTITILLYYASWLRRSGQLLLFQFACILHIVFAITTNFLIEVEQQKSQLIVSPCSDFIAHMQYANK